MWVIRDGEIAHGYEEVLMEEKVLYWFNVQTLKFYYVAIQNKYAYEYRYDGRGNVDKV